MRRHFDLDESLIYMNSGTQSITPRSVRNALIDYQKSYECNPTDGLITAWPRVWQVQKMLGRFVNADPKDLFLRPNVTLALNVFILGSKFDLPGGEILTTDQEYGAVLNIARMRCNRDGLALRQISISSSSEESLAAIITKQLRPETRMLLLSHVTTYTGLVLPIEEIARETCKRGIVLIVDGAHAAGALKLDFKRLEDVDYYAANLHKWVMGPKGTAFGWVARRHQNTLDPLCAGWTTFESMAPFTEFGEGSRFASKFLMLGCHDFTPYFALKDTLDFWGAHGEAVIRKNLFDLQMKLENEVIENLGLETLSPPPGILRGPLLAFKLPPRLAAEGYELAIRIYKERRLQVATPLLNEKSILRLSPHIYNTESECQRSIEILKEYFP